MIKVRPGKLTFPHVRTTRLAEELGVHELTVQRWKAGAHAPHGELRRAYAACWPASIR